MVLGGTGSEKEQGENMQVTVKEETLDIKAALNKISANSFMLKVQKGKIILNRENKDHKEWFEEDKEQ